jgi:ribosomal protein S18 acetylase RimI-like enzyme
MELKYIWTNGNDEIFKHFYLITEKYYSAIVGGEDKRKAFIPYNLSSSVEIVLIVLCDNTPVACSGLKKYSEHDVEIKRVWVEPDYRRNHIAKHMMSCLESKAKELGFQRMILQTREIMTDAFDLYLSLGYSRIDNYPPYDKLDGAICLAKNI